MELAKIMRADIVTRRQFGIGAVSVTSAVVVGCTSDGDNDHSEDGHDEHNEDEHDDEDHGHDDEYDDENHGHDHDSDDAVSNLEIIDWGDETVVADYHGHWHGNIPKIQLGDYVSLGAEFEDENGVKIPIGDDEEHQLGVGVTDDGESSTINIDSHGNHIHIHGESTGETAILFQLVQNDNIEWESSEAIAVKVISDDS